MSAYIWQREGLTTKVITKRKWARVATMCRCHCAKCWFRGRQPTKYHPNSALCTEGKRKTWKGKTAKPRCFNARHLKIGGGETGGSEAPASHTFNSWFPSPPSVVSTYLCYFYRKLLHNFANFFLNFSRCRQFIIIIYYTLKVWSAISSLADVKRMDSSNITFLSWESFRKTSQSKSSLGHIPITKSLNVENNSSVDSAEYSCIDCSDIFLLRSQCLRNSHFFSMQYSSLCSMYVDWNILKDSPWEM